MTVEVVRVEFARRPDGSGFDYGLVVAVTEADALNPGSEHRRESHMLSAAQAQERFGLGLPEIVAQIEANALTALDEERAARAEADREVARHQGEMKERMEKMAEDYGRIDREHDALKAAHAKLAAAHDAQARRADAAEKARDAHKRRADAAEETLAAADDTGGDAPAANAGDAGNAAG